jgi:hypothetical protein
LGDGDSGGADALGLAALQNHGLALSIGNGQGSALHGYPGVRPMSGLRKMPNFQTDLTLVQAEVAGTDAKPPARKRWKVSENRLQGGLAVGDPCACLQHCQ